VDFLYDAAYIGDGEYIALNKFTGDGVELIVLDHLGNLVYTKDSTDGLCFDDGYYNGVAGLLGDIHSMSFVNLPVKADGSILFNPTETDYSVYNEGYNEGYDFTIYENGYFSYYNGKTGKTVLFNTDAKQVASSSGFAYSFGKFVAEDNNK